MPEFVQLVSRRHWDHKIDRSRFLSIDPLNVERTGNGWPGYVESDTVVKNLKRLYGELPRVLFAYKPLEHHRFRNVPAIRVLQTNEVRPRRFLQEMKEARPTLVVFHHLNCYQDQKSLLKDLRIASAHIPHVTDPRVFSQDSGADKIWDVLNVGARSTSVYPLRAKFDAAANILADRGYCAGRYQHPGHELLDAPSNSHLLAFAHAVQRARIVTFCSSIYRYRLAKYVEVPACGTAVAADAPVSEDQMPFLIKCEKDWPAGKIADLLERTLQDRTDEHHAKAGLRYAEKYIPEYYCSRLLEELK